MAALIAGSALMVPTEPSFAKRAKEIREQPPVRWYRLSDSVRCVERSFSISVGNPAYRNRLAVWPAPCGR